VSALTEAEQDTLVKALSQPDDSCAHNFAPLFKAVERVVTRAEAVVREHWATRFADTANRAQTDLEAILRERDAEALAPVRTLLDTLAADLAKAEPRHFSIGLMRGRVKELQAAVGGAPS
jgi:hypothetical protein